MRITITSADDTITLSDRYDDPDHVWAIKKDGVKGLHGTPNIRESPLDRPQQDGAYWPSRLTQGSRTITLDCFIKGASTLEAAQARDRINALACKTLTLTLEDGTGTRMIDCYLTADPEPLMRHRMQAFEFALILTAPDPYWVGQYRFFETPSRDTRLYLANDGTAPSWPLIECVGPLTRFSIALDDGAVEWTGNADSLYLDTRDMIPSSGRVAVDLAFPIPPGGCRPRIRTDAVSTHIGVRPCWR